MPIKAQRFDRKIWSCTKKELKAEMEKESDLKTEKDVQYFLELKFHLVKGKTMQTHISQVMTILGLLSFKKKNDESVTEPIDVSDMTEAELIKSLPKSTSLKVSTIAKWLMVNQKFLTRGKRFHLWRYNPDIGIWIKDGEDFIRKIVTDMTGGDYKSHICNEVFAMIRSTSYDSTIELRGPEDIIVIDDGRLNLTTGKYIDGFNSEELQIVRVPIEYNPGADCPSFKQFLSEVLENEDDIQAIFELIGYCLWKFMVYDVFVIFVGLGANGKTVLLEVMTKFLGEENVSTVTLQQLALSRFASAGLLGKLANLAGEIPNEAIKDTSRIKELSGGGLIEGEYKFQDTFVFRNFAKLIFSTNEPPAIYDDTTGTWRRLRTFKFPRTFRKGEKGTIPRDVLVATLTTPTELSGILNEALAGWSRLRKYGKMTGDQKWEDQRLGYIRESNPVQFMTEKFFTPNYESGWIPKGAIYELYLKYCVNEGIKAVGVGWFHKQFKRYASFITEGHPRSAGDRVRAYSGLDIDYAGLAKIGVNLDGIRFDLIDIDQTKLEEYGFESGTGGTPGTPRPTPFPQNNYHDDIDKITTSKGVGVPVPAVPPVPAEKGLILDEFTDKKKKPLMVKLIKMWKRDKRKSNMGFKPRLDKDITLLLKGHDSKLVEERSGNFWWFTDKAKEEIEKWKL